MEYDIRSVWVKRPDIKGRLAWEFSGIHVDASLSPDGSVKWAIRSSSDFVMSKYDGCFYFERLPSERSEEWIEETRFDSLDEAIAFARTANPGRYTDQIQWEDADAARGQTGGGVQAGEV